MKSGTIKALSMNSQNKVSSGIFHQNYDYILGLIYSFKKKLKELALEKMIIFRKYNKQKVILTEL